MRTGNHEIEEYKGQTIYYDEDDDKFVCDITIEDNFKSTKRKSLKDVRKEIDAFIKVNLNFKPFKAIECDKYGRGEFTVKEVIAIRTDKKIVVKGGYSDSFYGKKDAENLRVYDADLVAEQKEIEEAYKAAGKIREEKLKKLNAKLLKLDLSNYDLA